MRSAIVITARIGSSRLPRKILADLGGVTVLESLIQRLRCAKRPDLLIVATTVEPEDDELQNVARQLGAEVFRGETTDILERWRKAAVAHDIDLLVTCDGDDVFCDPVHVDAIVDAHERTGNEYITCSGLPFGTAPTGIARSGLERVCARKLDTDTEGQGRFFEVPGIVTHLELDTSESLHLPEARMTLDYPEDLTFFRAVMAALAPDPCPPLEQIVRLLKDRPDIVAINAGLQAEYWRRFNARYGPVEVDA